MVKTKKQSKVLLINTPVETEWNEGMFPIGLASIAKLLQLENFDVKVMDANAFRLSKKEIIEGLKKFDFDYLAVGGLITRYKYIKWLLPEIRKINNKAKIVMGGSLPTSVPELVMEKIKPDAIILGEAEDTVKNLFNAYRSGSELKKVKGIWYLENRKIHRNPPNDPIENLDDLPMPAYDLFPVEIYRHLALHESGLRNRIHMVSSRGCPYTCGFCYHLFNRGTYRFRSPENIIKEIKVLYNDYNIRNITFGDDHFTANYKRLKDFCNLLIKENLDLTWSCLGRVDVVTEDLLRLMKKAGCTYIGFGIESGSAKILKNMNKKTSPKLAKRAIKLVRKVGIAFNTTFILGYPGEDDETLQESIDFCKEMKLLGNNFFILQAYPGTPVFEEALKMGKIKDLEKYVLELATAKKFVVNLTNWSDEELLERKQNLLAELKQSFLEQFFTRVRYVGFQNFLYWAAVSLKLTSRNPTCKIPTKRFRKKARQLYKKYFGYNLIN